MKVLPKRVSAYKKTAVFTQDTVPKALLNNHQTKAGVWGVIHVLSGQLSYCIDDEKCDSETVMLDKQTLGIVEPQISHYVTPVGEVAFYVEFCK